jgi:coenzyme F420-0:L-glutamate ligase/coenzyme F420-1:gamma-L-glutamate ligase
MSIGQNIKQRRSIRKFQSKKVPAKIINQILTLTGWAPSAHNSQPWRFILIEDLSLKHKLALSLVESWEEDLKKDGLKVDENTRKERIARYSEAPVLILACFSMDGLRKFSDSTRRSFERDLAVQSLGASLQTLLLSAHDLGLGACWYSAPGFCKQTVRKVLEIPDEIEPEAFIIIGYPDETPVVPEKKNIDQYCFRNKWGMKL